MTYLAVGCRVLIGVVFAVAVAGKLRGPNAFADFVRSIRGMGVLPPALARPAATAVVVAELTIVLAIAAPARTAGVLGFGLAAALLAAFTTGIATMLARGNRKPCRCFGRSETPLGARHVGRNIALVAVALVGLLASLSGTPVEPGLAVTVGVTAAVVGGLVVMLDDIITLL
ncbi:MauE/DoxX family redox-associated membrane protein [Polymorphospora sp. NPDC051019]|uniref:MauE/DoxX family redox-associated membrane protein n=1 Tax=Polymorphospora sp. NPDC051019 TaxID=3155725 RepID=UPI003413CA52